MLGLLRERGWLLVFTAARELDPVFLLAQNPPPQNLLPIFKPAWPRGSTHALTQDVILDPGQRRTLSLS